jgi:hypothetical protein
VLRGRLLTGHGERYMHHVAGGGGGSVADHTLWWPPSKVAGRRLAPYLAARDEPSNRGRGRAWPVSRCRPTSPESSRPPLPRSTTSRMGDYRDMPGVRVRARVRRGRASQLGCAHRPPTSTTPARSVGPTER